MSRASTSKLAVGLGLLMLVLFAASAPLGSSAHKSFFGGGGGIGLLFMPFAVVGLIVAWRQPRNSIGWILLALATMMILSTDAGLYSVIAFQLGHPSIPLARVATALTQTWIALVVLLPLPILLFPDGRLPSRRWRWSFWLYLLFSAMFVVATAVQDSHAFTDKVVRVDSSGELRSLGTSLGFAAVLFPAIYGGIVLSWVIGKIVEYRRSTGERRQQLKWLMCGGAVSFVALFLTLSLNGGFAFVGVAALPLSIGVGILKYRLYDIDRLISRTLSYAIVTGSLVAVFLGLVVLATDVLPFSSPVGVAASTLAAAALFTPLRRRVQQRWTGASTAPATTRTRRSKRSGSAYATRSTSRPFRPGSGTRSPGRSSPRISPSGCGAPDESEARDAQRGACAGCPDDRRAGCGTTVEPDRARECAGDLLRPAADRVRPRRSARRLEAAGQPDRLVLSRRCVADHGRRNGVGLHGRRLPAPSRSAARPSGGLSAAELGAGDRALRSQRAALSQRTASRRTLGLAALGLSRAWVPLDRRRARDRRCRSAPALRADHIERRSAATRPAERQHRLVGLDPERVLHRLRPGAARVAGP